MLSIWYADEQQYSIIPITLVISYDVSARFCTFLYNAKGSNYFLYWKTEELTLF